MSGPAPTASSRVVTHAAIVERAVDVNELVHMVADPGAGATAIFLGTVRNVNEGRPVVGIDYQAYEAMAARELQAIVDEAARRFSAHGVAAQHRIGFLELGEVSVGVVASHAHRGPAFDATRYVIEQIKRRVPVWKREHYVDGTREWVDPTRPAQMAVAGDAGDRSA